MLLMLLILNIPMLICVFIICCVFIKTKEPEWLMPCIIPAVISLFTLMGVAEYRNSISKSLGVYYESESIIEQFDDAQKEYTTFLKDNKDFNEGKIALVNQDTPQKTLIESLHKKQEQYTQAKVDLAKERVYLSSVKHGFWGFCFEDIIPEDIR